MIPPTTPQKTASANTSATAGKRNMNTDRYKKANSKFHAYCFGIWNFPFGIWDLEFPFGALIFIHKYLRKIQRAIIAFSHANTAQIVVAFYVLFMPRAVQPHHY